MGYCAKCGSKIPEGCSFCVSCGAKVEGVKNSQMINNTQMINNKASSSQVSNNTISNPPISFFKLNLLCVLCIFFNFPASLYGWYCYFKARASITPSEQQTAVDKGIKGCTIGLIITGVLFFLCLFME